MKASVLLLALVVALVSGCSTSGTSIPIGDGHPYSSTTPEGIVLLLEPPQRPHKVIALAEGVAATDDYFTKERTEAAALRAMREAAAKMGANAIVLTAKGSAPYGQSVITNSSATATATPYSISGYGTSVSTTMGWEKITFKGTAILYLNEEEQ